MGYEFLINTALKEVKKVWEIENGTGYIIGKVSTFNVTDNDLRSLCGINWLTDQVMDAYLSLIVQREIEKGNKITIYSSQTMAQIVSRTFSVINCRRKVVINENFSCYFYEVNTFILKH